MKGKIFNAQEVQALLNGSKVMFREVIKPQPDNNCGLVSVGSEGFGAYFSNSSSKKADFWEEFFPCPYRVGQKIFCKESFFEDLIYRNFVGYETENNLSDINARTIKINARYMKQEHSRLTLLIKEIKVERLGDISEEDAFREGNYLDRCECLPRKKDKSPIDSMFKQNWCHIHGQEFKDAWNTAHKKPEEKFEANPWVWVCTMEVVK